MNNEDRNLIAKQHCNKLIAEFMGHEPIVKGDDVYYELNHIRLTSADDLRYHNSWDWLMPVVDKCYKTGDDTHQWDDLMDAMFTCDISIACEQVVEFINKYNDGEQ